MANLVHDADVILIQEVQIDNDGTEGVRLLEIQLEQDGNTWNSSISKPTNGKGTECYAYLWKPAVLALDSAWLEVSLDSLIDREPYMARFKHKKKSILLANFHAVPKKKMPWKEIQELDELSNKYTQDHLIIAGDFNLIQSDSAFYELNTLGYKPALKGVKTTIKMEMKGDEKFANEYDNFFFNTRYFKLKEAGRIDFTSSFENLVEARKISDHLPVYVVLE